MRRRRSIIPALHKPSSGSPMPVSQATHDIEKSFGKRVPWEEPKPGIVSRLVAWADFQDWRINWGAVWFQLGRAVTLSAESMRSETLPHQPIVDRGKDYAREMFLVMTEKKR